MTLEEKQALRAKLHAARILLGRRRWAHARRELDVAIETITRGIEADQARAAASRGER